MRSVTHTKCGKPAIIYIRDEVYVTVGGIGMPSPSDYRHVDGSPITSGDPLVCDSCHEHFTTIRVSLDSAFPNVEPQRSSDVLRSIRMVAE